MVTQEWTAEEKQVLESLGFVLNFRGYYVSAPITLVKRLDLEFNELYYQAYNKDTVLDVGLVVNIPAYRVDESFAVFVQTLQDEVLPKKKIENLEDLINFLQEQNVQIIIKQDIENYYVTFDSKEYTFDAKNHDVQALENKILYLFINHYLN